MVRGVQHLHDQDIVHLDLKPYNWLVHSEDGEIVVKLTDFSAAHHTGDRLRASRCLHTPCLPL